MAVAFCVIDLHIHEHHLFIFGGLDGLIENQENVVFNQRLIFHGCFQSP